MSSIDVLLADDNVADARLAVEAMDLSTLSATIHVVGTGQEAIAFLTREEPHPQAPRPCVVLLDWRMPQQDGQDVLRVVRTDPALKFLPVVVFTGSDSRVDARAAYEAGANCYVRKPNNFEEYLAVVQEIVTFWCRRVIAPAD